MSIIGKQNRNLEKKTLLKVNSSANKFEIYSMLDGDLIRVPVDYDIDTNVAQAILEAIRKINQEHDVNFY